MRERMANSYFQFKQFTVNQDQCAMKVCTDSCIFGAWLNQQLNDSYGIVNKVIDIGAGTGLLSLMLAQDHKEIVIDAVEIEEAAFLQAKNNISKSPFSNQIKIIHTSLQSFVPSYKYDLIISNPPFYANDLKSPTEIKNAAKHDSTLTLTQLLDFMQRQLTENGTGALLLPYHRLIEAKILIEEAGLFLQKLVSIKQTPNHDFFRCIIMFSRKEKNEIEAQQFSIKNEKNAYSEECIELLQPFYLHM